MSSATTIQYLGPLVDAVTGAALPLDVSNKRQTEVFITGEQVFVGDVVCLDLITAGLNDGQIAQQVRRAQSTTTTRRAVVGVVLRSVDTAAGAFTPSTGACAAGTKIEVVIRGVCQASCLALTVGDVLTYDPAGALGALDTVTALTQQQVAVALETVAAPGFGTVFVLGNMS